MFLTALWAKRTRCGVRLHVLGAPLQGATCSPWPFEKPWGLPVCSSTCPPRPPTGGRHVPHGHLESHGDYTFALPHVLFVVGRFVYWLANLQTPTPSSITLIGHTKLLQPTHFHDDSSEHMTPMCSRCRDALSATDSSTSSSEGPGTLSSTCGVRSAPSRHDGPAGKAPGGALAAA